MTTPTTRTRTARKPFSNDRPEGIPTNKSGFPLARCSRCGGTGQYPSSAYRGICLGCSGTGHVDFSRSSRRQRLAYEAHVVETQTTLIDNIQVGDTIYASYGMTGYKWSKVTGITREPDVEYGTSKSGDNVTVYTGRLVVNTEASGSSYPMFANGEPVTTYTVRRWSGRIDPSPWLAKINYNAN